ncbi:MAG: hypothetical protein ACRD2A_20065, partial [Vicinamibacterales bacterium]
MTELIWDGKYDDKGRKVAPTGSRCHFRRWRSYTRAEAARCNGLLDLLTECRQLRTKVGDLVAKLAGEFLEGGDAVRVAAG